MTTTTLADAIPALEAAANTELAKGTWWLRIDAGDAYVVIARILDQLARPAEADRFWKKALDALEDIDQLAYQRRGARVRAIVTARAKSL